MKSIVFLARDAHTKVEGTSMKHLLDSMRQIPTKTHRDRASSQPEERLLGPGVSHKKFPESAPIDEKEKERSFEEACGYSPTSVIHAAPRKRTALLIQRSSQGGTTWPLATPDWTSNRKLAQRQISYPGQMQKISAGANTFTHAELLLGT